MLRFIFGFLVIIALFIGFPAFYGYSKGPNVFKEQEKITIGVVRTEAVGLIYIANEQGFFGKRGLDVSIKEYDAGAHAAGALVMGEVDIATASEFVFVLRSFEESDLRVLASIGAAQDTFLIAKKDGSITNPVDLRGKRIGTVRGSILDFFLWTFLAANGLPPNSVQILSFKPSEALGALEKDQVDAVVTFGPFFLQIQRSLGEMALVWPVQEGQEFYFLAMAKEALIKGRPLAVERFLEALKDAETYQKERSAAAREILGRCLRMDDSFLYTISPHTRLALRLDQTLLILMEEEAKWALRNRLIEDKRIPNYFHSMHLDGLEKVKPEAVTIFH